MQQQKSASTKSSNMHGARTNSRTHSKLAMHTLALCAAAPTGNCAAATWMVDTCADTTGRLTVGSLRYAVAQASDNDVVDLSTLSCSTISLQTGAIIVMQPHLHFLGPGRDKLTISGAAQHDRIFKQQLPSGYLGELYFSDISISGGDLTAYVNSAGGCIYSYTRVTLTNADVSHCHLHSPTDTSGGAIFAKQSVTLTSSSVTASDATASGNAFYYGVSRGGGVFTHTLSMEKSTISDNIAKSTHPGGSAIGGGFYATGGTLRVVSLRDSTISGNTASGVNGASGLAGGAAITPDVPQTIITNSTISDNVATHIVGGILTTSPSIVVRNSTISNNSALSPPSASGNAPIWASGFATNSALGPVDISLQSTIIANNTQSTAAPYASDFGAVVAQGNSLTIAGSNNLVGVALAASVPLPVDTLLGACPLLGPLRDNGGATPTRALLSHSPAIDVGANPANLVQDQRGLARVSGSAADIGAYELDHAESVFSASFDGCP